MTGAERAFDKFATDFDALFSRSLTGQRNKVRKLLKRMTPAEFPNVLELNCGTGEDAKWLLEKGHQVTATDISSGMIEIARRKPSGVEFYRADMRNLKSVLPGRKFNLIFSNFGGLNCVSPSDLLKISADAASLLEPGGKMLLIIMGRNCRWERFYFRRKKQPEHAVRRLDLGPVTAVINGNAFPVWYYSPREFENAFSAEFEVLSKKPIGLFLPPSYLDSWFIKRKFLLHLLSGLETLFSFQNFADDADHYAIELIKRKS